MIKNSNAIKVSNTISDELLIIQQRVKNGLITPNAVVEYARDSNTALHDRFEWDDSIAGEKYRLWQARQIISLELIVVDNGQKRETSKVISMEQQKDGLPTRKFISLTRDRKGDETGYRIITDVLENEEYRLQLLEDAKSDMIRFKIKYKNLKELSDVFSVMNNHL